MVMDKMGSFQKYHNEIKHKLQKFQSHISLVEIHNNFLHIFCFLQLSASLHVVRNSQMQRNPTTNTSYNIEHLLQLEN